MKLKNKFCVGTGGASETGTTVGRPGITQEVAATAVFLVNDESSPFVGQTLSPNGGYITH